MSIDVRVNGSYNQVLVAGGDLYHVDLHLPQPAPDDRRNLLNLMERVRQTWVRNVLEHSVHHATLLELGMRAVPSAVDRPWAGILEAAGHGDQVLPPGTRITRVFEDVGRTLLILGEPGAGKTISLLTLAGELIERAERDTSAPIPVVFNLSTWAESRKPIHDWLVSELYTHYRTGEGFARRWLKEHRLVLLLDGLDEVAEERRAACVEALHAFVEKHGISGVAVCCRRSEYLALPVKLRVGGAVSLLPLTQEQIDAWFDAAGDRLAGLRGALGENTELRALAESPLMLNIMSVSYANLPASALSFGQAPTRDALRDQVFAAYVERMFTIRKRRGGEFAREKADEWLRWLAGGMVRRGESIFAVELLQPAWLTQGQLRLYTVLSRVAGGVVMAAVIGGVVCLGLYVLVLSTDSYTRSAFAKTSAAEVVNVVLACLAAAAATGLVTGLVYSPLDYRRLRHSQGGGPRRFEGVREFMMFSGYMVLSILSAGIVSAVATRGFTVPAETFAWTAVVTVMVAVPSLPVFFARKPGRGTAEGDIALAGSLTWNWRSAREMVIAAGVAGGILVGCAALLGVSRAAAGALVTISALTGLAYGGWRHEVPPVERWADGVGTSALFNSGKVFVVAGTGWVVVASPLTWLMLGPRTSPGSALVIAMLTAIFLISPALFWFGGLDFVLHAALRAVLALTGTLPLRLRRFLDYGVHLGFLQRAGGGYIFIHGLLREHFAARARAGAADGTS